MANAGGVKRLAKQKGRQSKAMHMHQPMQKGCYGPHTTSACRNSSTTASCHATGLTMRTWGSQ